MFKAHKLQVLQTFRSVSNPYAKHTIHSIKILGIEYCYLITGKYLQKNTHTTKQLVTIIKVSSLYFHARRITNTISAKRKQGPHQSVYRTLHLIYIHFHGTFSIRTVCKTQNTSSPSEVFGIKYCFFLRLQVIGLHEIGKHSDNVYILSEITE